MTDTTNEDIEPTEREVLMERARVMNIPFSNNIGTDTLRDRIAAALKGDDAPVEDEQATPVEQDEDEPELVEEQETPVADTPEPEVSTLEYRFPPVGTVQDEPVSFPAPTPAPTPVEPAVKTLDQMSKTERRNFLRREANRLVRVRIQNLDPKKANLHGEIMAVANETIGTIRKFIPFGEVTDDGWHVPHALYEMMKERRFLHIRTITDKRTGNITVDSKYMREFAIERLDPLTPDELARLAVAQMAAGVITNDAGELTN